MKTSKKLAAPVARCADPCAARDRWRRIAPPQCRPELLQLNCSSGRGREELYAT